jgi:hypothetical protein
VKPADVTVRSTEQFVCAGVQVREPMATVEIPVGGSVAGDGVGVGGTGVGDAVGAAVGTGVGLGVGDGVGVGVGAWMVMVPLTALQVMFVPVSSAQAVMVTVKVSACRVAPAVKVMSATSPLMPLRLAYENDIVVAVAAGLHTPPLPAVVVQAGLDRLALLYVMVTSSAPTSVPAGGSTVRSTVTLVLGDVVAEPAVTSPGAA